MILCDRQDVKIQELTLTGIAGTGEVGGGGGCGGLFLACEDLGKMFDNLFPASAFF